MQELRPRGPPAGGGSPPLESGLSLVVPQSCGRSQEQPVLGQRPLQTPHLSEMIEALCWPCPCPCHTSYTPTMPALSPPLCPGPSHLPSLAGQPPAIAQSPKPARPSPVVVLQACVEGRTQHGPQHSPQSQLLLPPLPPGRPGLAPAPSLPDARSFLPSSPGPQPPAPGLTSAALPPPPS